jgi:hypothetical protein
MRDMLALFAQILPILDGAFRVLENKIEKPAFVKRGNSCVFRYETQSIEAAVIQKMARRMSGLHASLVLLRTGFVQEMGVIFRTLDEFDEDISFLCEAVRNGRMTELHQKYLASFYQEEFDKPDNPFLSEQKRPTISRQKIRAAITRAAGNPLNPSDAQRLKRMLSQAYSGYVHGASVHILEMYGGDPPGYHLCGMCGTPRIEELTANYWDYLYRGIMVTALVAVSFGEVGLAQKLDALGDDFRRASGKAEWEDLDKLLRKIKEGKA